MVRPLLARGRLAGSCREQGLTRPLPSPDVEDEPRADAHAPDSQTVKPSDAQTAGYAHCRPVVHGEHHRCDGLAGACRGPFVERRCRTISAPVLIPLTAWPPTSRSAAYRPRFEGGFGLDSTPPALDRARRRVTATGSCALGARGPARSSSLANPRGPGERLKALLRPGARLAESRSSSPRARLVDRRPGDDACNRV